MTTGQCGLYSLAVTGWLCYDNWSVWAVLPGCDRVAVL